jgi:hypothetical protein
LIRPRMHATEPIRCNSRARSAASASRALASAVAVALLLPRLTAGQPPADPRSSTPCRYQASILGASDVGPGGHDQTLEIAIERWSSWTTEERLIATLATSSLRAFLDALTNAERVGFLELPDGSSFILHYAQEHLVGNDMRQIVAASDRRFGSWTSSSADRTEYPFGFIEILVNGDGVGDGRVATAGRAVIRRDAQRIDLQAARDESIRLADVHRIGVPEIR